MDLPEITDAATWRAARTDLLAREKEMSRQRDELAAARRRLPMRVPGVARPTGGVPEENGVGI